MSTKTTETNNKIVTDLKEVTGLGVIVTQTLGDSISTVYVPGAKIKNGELVTIISD